MGGAFKAAKSLDDAEGALKNLQQHAETAVQHPAIPKIAPKDPAVTATESAKQAEKALSELSKQGDKVAALVGDPAVTALLTKRETAVKTLEKMEGEAEFRKAAAVKLPTKIFENSEDVKEYSQGLAEEKRGRQREMDEQLIRDAAAKGNISEAEKNLKIFGKRAGEFFMDLAAGMSFTNKIHENRENEKFEERNEKIHGEVAESMAEKEKYMGAEAYASYKKNPTVIATIDLPGEAKFGELGVFFRDTNSIAIDRAIDAPAQASVVIRHEEYHRAAEVAGGRSMRWRDEAGKPVTRTDVESKSLHEGLTESFAQQDESRRGNNSSIRSYPKEVFLVSYIQEVAGREPLEKAYFTGDFSEVRGIMDEKLGKGSFDRVIAITDATDAANMLATMAEAKGMDTSQWDKNPILERAKSRIF